MKEPILDPQPVRTHRENRAEKAHRAVRARSSRLGGKKRETENKLFRVPVENHGSEMEVKTPRVDRTKVSPEGFVGSPLPVRFTRLKVGVCAGRHAGLVL